MVLFVVLSVVTSETVVVFPVGVVVTSGTVGIFAVVTMVATGPLSVCNIVNTITHTASLQLAQVAPIPRTGKRATEMSSNT